MTDDEIKQLVASNAKAIQALTDVVAQDRNEWKEDRNEWQKDRNEWQKDRNEWKEDRNEWRQDRRRVFEWMARLAAAQADFYEAQADYLHHVERIDDRLAEILNRLTPKDEQGQG